jgi:hypothetical protein
MTHEYEAMRSQVTGGAAGTTTTLGLALFMRRGLTAWLKMCSSLPSTAARMNAPGRSDAPIPHTPTLELASLLADMAMRHAGCGNAF